MIGLFLGARWLVEREHSQIPPDKMWLPLASVTVIASGQEVDALLGEMSAFAAEKNIAVPTFPKKSGGTVALRIPLTERTFFAVDNYGLGQHRFVISAYSHDDTSVWESDWEKLTARLRSRLGNDHVIVKIEPRPH
jgi:hypothetical protein